MSAKMQVKIESILKDLSLKESSLHVVTPAGEQIAKNPRGDNSLYFVNNLRFLLECEETGNKKASETAVIDSLNKILSKVLTVYLSAIEETKRDSDEAKQAAVEFAHETTLIVVYAASSKETESPAVVTLKSAIDFYNDNKTVRDMIEAKKASDKRAKRLTLKSIAKGEETTAKVSKDRSDF